MTALDYTPNQTKMTTTRPSLAELFSRHQGYVSDKWEQYLAVYDSELRFFADKGTPVSLLEIGIQNGGSLQIWKEYLPPGSRIVGVDIDGKCAELEFSDGVEVYIGSATDRNFLDGALSGSSFDIIIDDGSHISSDIIDTFKLLFDRLRSGGKYFVEDLHCSYMSEYEGGYRRKNSSIEWAKSIIDALNFDYVDVQSIEDSEDRSQLRALGEQVGRVSFFDSMMVIEKLVSPKQKPYRRLLSGAEAPIFTLRDFVRVHEAASLRNLLVGPDLLSQLPPRLLDELDAARGALAGERRLVADLESRVEEIPRLTEQLKEREELLEERKEHLNERREQVARLTVKVERLSSEVEKYRAEAEQHRAGEAQLANNLTHHQQQLSEVKDRLAKRLQETQSLRKEVRSLKRSKARPKLYRALRFLYRLSPLPKPVKQRLVARYQTFIESIRPPDLKSRGRVTRQPKTKLHESKSQHTKRKQGRPAVIPDGRARRGTSRRGKARRRGGGQRPTYQQRLAAFQYRPKVSAIIPNFNHARFLPRRIESILEQTYNNVEILILDDHSTDHSRDVIEHYVKEYPGRIRTLFNDANSGNVFRQWRRGIEQTDGDLVWLCESDDFCEPTFLECLVRYFGDRSVNLAFGRIQFCNKDGVLQEGADQYREGAEPNIWHGSVVRPASEWFSRGFGVNNVIPNVGGCLWRRQTLSERTWSEAATFSVLGDWFLYLNVARGGQIAYEPNAVSYFRQHGGNTSVAAVERPNYYEEHQRLMTALRAYWGVPPGTVVKFWEKVRDQYLRNGLSERLGPFENYVDLVALLETKRDRIHILIGLLGFYPGGGEVFPIHLANELHAQGHTVSLLAYDLKDVNEELLAAVNPAISVYDCAWVRAYGRDKFLTDAGISIIHSHMAVIESFFFEHDPIKTKIPYAVSLHGSYEASPPSDERMPILTSRVSHFVYTTDRNLEPFRALSIPAKFTKLGNAMPMDLAPFPKTREDLGIAPDAVVFTLVARGIKRKGWRSSVSAFSRLRARFPERKMHLLLCGSGEETDRQQVAHGTDPDITFLGFQARIHGLYRLSDVAIVPTRFQGESFPLCIIQALQVGKPVISTKVGEIESMLTPPGQDPGGVLIDPVRDTEVFISHLAEAMAQMLEPARREEIATAARKLGTTYSMEKVARNYIDLYYDLLEIKAP